RAGSTAPASAGGGAAAAAVAPVSNVPDHDVVPRAPLPAAGGASAAVPAWVDRKAYPFNIRSLPLAEGRMNVVDHGRGEPIVFVHGTPTWSFEYRHLIRGLSETHRCLAPDHLGFGLSARPRDIAYTPEAHAVRLAEAVDLLRLDSFTLVVHDYGGPIGLPLALTEPGRVRRVVVLNSWMWGLDDDSDMRRKARMAGGRLGKFLYRRFNASLRGLMPFAYGDRRRLTRAIHGQYLAPFPDAWSRGAVLWPLARALLGSGAFYRQSWEQRERLRDVPALIVWGMKDRAFPPRLLERWRGALPHAAVVQLDDAGHWPHEEQPDAVLRAVRDFLAAP
ncbi:MAG: alpha/beta fold hydrolase, partial [Haliangium ochraceum]